MSGRSWEEKVLCTSKGLVLLAVSFLTNNVSNPANTGFRGAGGLTGGDAAGGVSNSGPTAVASITRTGVGAFLVTLQDGYRFVQAASCSIDDAADALIARNGAPTNEGAGNSVGIGIPITVRAAATSTATESTGRRISLILLLKNSAAGA